MNIRFLEAAQKEIDEAVEWYNHQSPGLGMRFLYEIDRSLMRICDYPFLCAKIEPDIRRCLVNKFPYGLIYSIDEDQDVIVIIAAAHLHRRPRYWYDRIV